MIREQNQNFWPSVTVPAVAERIQTHHCQCVTRALGPSFEARHEPKFGRLLFFSEGFIGQFYEFSRVPDHQTGNPHSG
jgi:hypothetical protein